MNLRDTLREFQRSGATSVLQTYLTLHRGKLGMHWLWAVVQRVAAGESQASVLEDYGMADEWPAGQASAIARRKRAELEAEGYVANGIAIIHPATRRRGLIDRAGAVHWIAKRP